MFDDPAPLEPEEPDELPRPVDVDPEAPPVPVVPALPDEPRVEPPEPEPPLPEPSVEPLPDDPDPPLEPRPELLPLDAEPELEPELFIALFNCTFPLASRQCVVGEMLLLEVAPLVPPIDPDEPDPDCAKAESAPHAISADASNVVFNTFI